MTAAVHILSRQDWIITQSGQETSIPLEGSSKSRSLYEAGWIPATPVWPDFIWQENADLSHASTPRPGLAEWCQIVPRPKEWPESWRQYKELEASVIRDIREGRATQEGNPLTDYPAAYRVQIDVFDEDRSAEVDIAPEVGRLADYRATVEALVGCAEPFHDEAIPGNPYGAHFQHGWAATDTLTVPGIIWDNRIEMEVCFKLARQMLDNHKIEPGDLFKVGAGAVDAPDDDYVDLTDALRTPDLKDRWQADEWDISPDKTVWIALPKDAAEPCSAKEALCRATAISDASPLDALVMAESIDTNPQIARLVETRRQEGLSAVPSESENPDLGQPAIKRRLELFGPRLTLSSEEM